MRRSSSSQRRISSRCLSWSNSVSLSEVRTSGITAHAGYVEVGANFWFKQVPIITVVLVGSFCEDGMSSQCCYFSGANTLPCSNRLWNLGVKRAQLLCRKHSLASVMIDLRVPPLGKCLCVPPESAVPIVQRNAIHCPSAQTLYGGSL
jgi:hypothetical protein